MRFIVKQIKVAGNGSSDLTRYVAKSKPDPQREGREARPLFTREADQLSFWQAREWLSITGGEWAGGDALHYVLSFAEAREYELLGDDEPARRLEIRAYLRQALDVSLRHTGLAEMRWAAGLHRNTAHPHLHLLLNKNAASRITGDLLYLPRLPREMLPHNAIQPNGGKAFTPGLLAAAFAAQVDARHRERTRWLQFTAPWPEAVLTRAVLAPETLLTRPPTPAERLAGQWLLAELRLDAPGKTGPAKPETWLTGLVKHQPANGDDDTSARELQRLRDALAKIDKIAVAHGHTVPPAYLSNEELRAVLLSQPTHWRVTAQQHNPVIETVHPRNLPPSTMPEKSVSHPPEHAIEKTLEQQRGIPLQHIR
jgi:hypothetical protein